MMLYLFTLFMHAKISVYDYAASNSDFTFTCIPAKGRGIEMMAQYKETFDKENGTNSLICRRFSKNYFKFWLWEDYLNSPYYQFPFCE